MSKHRNKPTGDTGVEEAPETSGVESERRVPARFPIVGIGASAGGLAAFEAFFSGLPADVETGMAFVVVQHLAPDHKSILTELIGRCTAMPVSEATDGMPVNPDCAYIIPPGYDMTLAAGTLRLSVPSKPRGRRLPVDSFFRSLAEDQGEHSIAVVLSGTGGDGTLGIRAIKGAGGMVMAQTPESTEHDGMPRSAIATGLVDFELPPEQMGDALIAYCAQAFVTSQSADTVPTRGNEDRLAEVFRLLRAQVGHDFSLYKSSTIMRRIERRMIVNHVETLQRYVENLQQSDTEVQALFRDLLISVTSFFRDPGAFESLERTAIPELFDGRAPGETIRVWSPGCATGEEAYSLAILLREQIEKLNQSYKVQLFATDIDSRAIATARSGVYPASIAADVEPDRLRRYFTAEHLDSDGAPHAYRIAKGIRDMVVFSEQNVIKDPPFSKIDLISCRNLMIYLNRELHERLIPRLHYAMKPGGILFLGPSETVGEFGDLFTTLDRRAKLYRRTDAAPSTIPSGPDRPPSPTNIGFRRKTEPPAGKVPLRELVERMLLRQFAPAAVLVDSRGDIHYLHGRTGRYLEPGTGEVATYNVLTMAREGLRHEVAAALHQVVQDGQDAHRRGLRVKTNSHHTSVNLCIHRVIPDPGESLASSFYLVVFNEGQSSADGDRDVSTEPDEEHDSGRDDTIEVLRRELRAKEEYLQSANEQLETSNEELKSSNEEMQSVNEELQSSNEELETSKEELQSVNEELATVNAELQTKVADLSRANNDMNNMLAGTGIATVFLDHQLRVMRFTPSANEIINLIPSDIGRPVTDIVSNLVGYDRMVEDVQSVLDTLASKRLEVQVSGGRWYRMHILPYRTLDNVIEGAVISFVDITERRQAEQEIARQLADKETLLKEVHHRIRNNTASIAGLLTIQAQSITDSEARSVLRGAIGRVDSMSVLYDKLLVSEQYGASSVMNYLEGLADTVMALFPDDTHITLEKRIVDFDLKSADLFLLGLITNELLTNVMKYAFDGRTDGRITLLLERSGDRVRLVVRDNGRGLPPGFDPESSTGFGLTLVRMLSEQLGGTFCMTDQNGTESVLEFDL